MSVWTPPGYVDCGGHFAKMCALCPEGNGDVWCNGECSWVVGLGGHGQCMHASVVPWLPELPGGIFGHLIWWLTSFCGCGCIMLIWAAVYKTQVIEEMPRVPEMFNITGKKLNLLACFLDPHTCLYTTFCMPIVIGKNYYGARVMDFWPGCILSYILTYSPFCCIGAVIRTVLAQQVQKNLGHTENIFVTFLMNTFCLPCAVGKESLEVDEETGVKITCLCNLWKPPPIPVIAPVIVEVDNAKDRVCHNSFGMNRFCAGGH